MTFIHRLLQLALVLNLLALPAARGDDLTVHNVKEAELHAAAAEGKLAFVIFYREVNPRARAMFAMLKAAVAEDPAGVALVTIQVSVPAERAVAERLHVERAPMPLLLAVHPNGAVTGAFAGEVTAEQLAASRVSPKQADCLKALQHDRLVLLCVQSSAEDVPSHSVTQMQDDPHFGDRVEIITLAYTDAEEAAFLQQLEIDPAAEAAWTVFMAPPAVLVGKFPAGVTQAELADALAAAGKCCDDENCQHNRKSGRKSPARQGVSR